MTATSFPLDNLTLTHVEHALDTHYGDPHPDGGFTIEGGEFTLDTLLLFLSGYDETKLRLVSGDPEAKYPGEVLGLGPDTPIYVYDGPPRYSERSLIRALVAEVRRMREAYEPEQDA